MVTYELTVESCRLCLRMPNGECNQQSDSGKCMVFVKVRHFGAVEVNQVYLRPEAVGTRLFQRCRSELFFSPTDGGLWLVYL